MVTYLFPVLCGSMQCHFITITPLLLMPFNNSKLHRITELGGQSNQLITVIDTCSAYISNVISYFQMHILVSYLLDTSDH